MGSRDHLFIHCGQGDVIQELDLRLREKSILTLHLCKVCVYHKRPRELHFHRMFQGMSGWRIFSEWLPQFPRMFSASPY